MLFVCCTFEGKQESIVDDMLFWVFVLKTTILFQTMKILSSIFLLPLLFSNAPVHQAVNSNKQI